jgi:hypothetical protein
MPKTLAESVWIVAAEVKAGPAASEQMTVQIGRNRLASIRLPLLLNLHASVGVVMVSVAPVIVRCDFRIVLGVIGSPLEPVVRMWIGRIKRGSVTI